MAADDRDRIADEHDRDADLREEILNDVARHLLDCEGKLVRSERLNDQLRHALVTRICVEQAKGLIAGERGIGVSEAFELLRSHSRSHNVTVQSLAHAVVELGLRP